MDFTELMKKNSHDKTILNQIDSLTNENYIKKSSRKNVVGFALFFGGIGFSVQGYHSVVETGGSFYIDTGISLNYSNICNQL